MTATDPRHLLTDEGQLDRERDTVTATDPRHLLTDDGQLDRERETR